MRPTGPRVVLLHALVLALLFPLTPSPTAAARPVARLAQGQAGQPPSAPPDQKRPDGYAIAVTVPVVNVDVTVTDDNGNYLTTLKQENFRLTEDGSTQMITNFSTSEAPITVVLLVEYSKLGYGWFMINAENWANVFLSQLKPTDWVALASFNLNTKVEVDFTHSTEEIRQGLRSLYYPPFSESNLFDAVGETIDRLADVKGRKSILVLASGFDTFSKLTLDKALARIKEADLPINTVGVGEQAMLRINGGLGVEYAQAQNQLRTFAALTGGRSWFPRFDGEIPGIMGDVAASLRSQYSLAYTPSNRATDGKYRKIKVAIVNPDGSPLVITDQKGKKRNFHVYARQGYTAPKSSIN
jgi:VWFA-related protein